MGRKQIYPQTIVGWVAWMSCSQRDAWCHQMKLMSKGCGKVTVLLEIYNHYLFQ